jgi:ketosteroid isomerase-like protein
VTTEEIQETVDYIAITRLLSAYADAVNRRSWPSFVDLFTPDATVHIDTVTSPAFDLVGPAEVGQFISGAVERFEFFEFVILNTHVEMWPDGDHDVATARVFMHEIRIEHDGGRRTDAHGVYHDRYLRHGGRWVFAERHYQSLSRTPRPDVFPLPDPPPGWPRVSWGK